MNPGLPKASNFFEKKRKKFPPHCIHLRFGVGNLT